MSDLGYLTVDTFFVLVDAVLTHEDVKRQALDPSGPQRKIINVADTDRVLQILAGPGSGKTEMLVWRILFELLVIGSRSETVLVTTFTKKAATELEVRLVDRCDLLLKIAADRGIHVADPHVHDIRIGTLHSLCDALLRDFDSAYMESGTQLMDEHEATVRLVKNFRYKLGYESRPGQAPRAGNTVIDTPEVSALFRPPWEGERWPSNDLQRASLLNSAMAQHVETWMPRCSESGILNGVDTASGESVTEALVKIYERWTEYLREQAITDFTTIQQMFLNTQDQVINKSELTHVFVDEFQDTNPVQFAIHVGWLASPKTRLTVVGDDDQSVYRFRGSDIRCFQGLEDECERLGLGFRLERLEENYRSTCTIISLSEQFRRSSVLSGYSMPKNIVPAATSMLGKPVRLLIGPWQELCDAVASEILQVRTSLGGAIMPEAALLMFSTSEKSSRARTSPALQMRTVLESAGLRVFNARNKTAGRPGSPVHDLLALISYLIDPVRQMQIPTATRAVEVHASHRERNRHAYAEVAPPPKYSNDTHAAFQKRFRKEGGSLASPAPDRAEILQFVDDLRAELHRYAGEKQDRRRLTLAAFVARLLSHRYFRDGGYTPQLFRQALFTALMEANIAPSRRTTRSLDAPMRPILSKDGKLDWPQQYWDLLSLMSTMLESSGLDDEEVEAFSENAFSMLTFHQAKGLEFDIVYVAATGRNVTPANALSTTLFSGNEIDYQVVDGQAETSDPEILGLAQADREREVYVAITRAKKQLTILYDPTNTSIGMRDLNPGLAAIFDKIPAEAHPFNPAIQIKNYRYAAFGGLA
ncbi:ATP-dependent helicase [Streptosporangium roseum]|uniref:ATP-dependent helicase n=1 Tax=Streptosporangium roseum TaxID=2001 RepID=UPI00332AC980